MRYRLARKRQKGLFSPKCKDAHKTELRQKVPASQMWHHSK